MIPRLSTTGNRIHSAITPDEHDLRYEGWRVAAASGAGVFVGLGSLFAFTFGVFLKPITAEFHWSREAVSVAYGITAAAVAMASPPLGFLLDRTSARRVAVPCVIVFGAAFASLALLTPRRWHLYAVFLIFGIVGNGTAQMAYSRAVSSWFVERRGMALGIVVAGGGLGAIVWPPIAEALIQRVGWRAAYAILGAAVLAIGVPAAGLFVRERPAAAGGARANEQATAGATVREGLASPVFWMLVTVLFFSSIAQTGVVTHLSALLTDRGVAPGDAAIAISALGGGSLAGRLVCGWLLDHFTASRVGFVLLAMAAAGIFLLSSADSAAAGAIAAGLVGFGIGGEASVTPYLLARYFGLRSLSMLYGFTWTAFAFAGAIGPVLMGKAFDATGSYETLLVRLAIASLAVAALMLLMPRPGSSYGSAAARSSS